MKPSTRTLVVALLLIGTTTAQASETPGIFNRKKKKAAVVEVIEQPAEVTPVVEQPKPVEEAKVLNPYSANFNTRSVAEYDSLLTIWNNEHAVVDFDSFHNDFINIDSVSTIISEVPDSVLERRLRNIVTPIQLPFNSVIKQYIVAYTT
ncbi:MAG: hypothetical protein R3Y15_06920, partial [Rikenellaceae bacterium]